MGAQVDTPAPTIVNPSSGEVVVAPVDVCRCVTTVPFDGAV